ncbi:MAG TPA: DUF1624 domain-containing protein [Candidatus Corynebacterium avicola]|uniref:DUF1624 domain-containing protein n=1 Tax=Candidatus Corynebacterium avicola TaxID=2838527 RepID=A0A9D1ULF1_9CORY|nr:DUF1624 domain-containing protein [Candidatus Corynebacterium avicola]
MTIHDQNTARPAPGPAAVRPIWDGENSIDPASYTPPPPPEPAPTPGRWTKAAAFGPLGDTRRLVGLDCARGVALLGMVAVHSLPAYNEYTGAPTIIWRLFAGHSAVLFAVLTGVTIALITGANNPKTGRSLLRARWSLTVRALVILLLGLTMGFVDIPVYNILPYYGLMFLLAVPLTGLRIRSLVAVAVSLLVLGPVVIRVVTAWNGFTTVTNPSFADVVSMPTDVLITLFVGGTYPVVTWFAFVCLGMAVARLNLRWLMTQARLVVVGVGVALVGYLTSSLLIDFAGGFEQLYLHSDGLEAEDIGDILAYGPEGQLPTGTNWWFAVAGPHTNMPLWILAAAGVALMVIGVFLVVSRIVTTSLTPLAASGSMTLTLYTGHLLFLAFFWDDMWDRPVLWFSAQVVGLVSFATAWHLAHGRGPLEEVISRTCRRISRAIVRDEKVSR